MKHNIYDFAYQGVPFTKDQCRDAIEYALFQMEHYSYYKPLIERFPLRVDNECTKKAMDNMKAKDTFACTDHNNIYFLTENFVARFNEHIDEHLKKGGDYSDCNLAENIVDILAHEYTHILSLHQKIAKGIMKRYGNVKKIPQQVWFAHTYAAEIEANRGDLINYEHAIQENAVNEKNFPDTYHIPFYRQLFEYFLKQSKDRQQNIAKSLVEQLLENAQKAKQEGDQEMGEAMEQAANEIKKMMGGGQGQENEGEGEEGEESGSDSNGNGTGADKNNRTVSWPELTEEDIKEAMDKAEETQHELGQGHESGIGLESTECEYECDLTPKDRLDKEYARWERKEVKKELKKMKGLIRGAISKNRESTYARPTRRPITSGSSLIKKGVRYEKSYSPKVLIAMDSSGSMCSTTMKEVACAIENIFKDLGKPKVGSYICKHESTVSDVKPMREWDKVVESYHPSGGNCFLNVVREANKLGVDVVLNIGDGQDVVNRRAYDSDGKNLDPECASFLGSNRKWFDVLVTDKNNNAYYLEEKEVDEKSGFHREAIFLGNKISKYLK